VLSRVPTGLPDMPLVTKVEPAPAIKDLAEQIVPPETLDKAGDVAGAIVDAAQEHGGQIVSEAAKGNWFGVISGIFGFVVAVWTGLVVRKRIKRRKLIQRIRQQKGV